MLESKTIRLRLVDIDDAEFILSLRLDDNYNKYLSGVSPSLFAQKEWIENYKADELNKKQFYFIIETLDGVPCGTVRVYDLKESSFSWGSWILNQNKTRYAAIESAYLVYEFGFKQLGFCKSHFEVMKGNDRVVSFHMKMGAMIVSEDDQNFYFTIDHSVVEESRRKVYENLKFL